jgi:hypothetical protein
MYGLLAVLPKDLRSNINNTVDDRFVTNTFCNRIMLYFVV